MTGNRPAHVIAAAPGMNAAELGCWHEAERIDRRVELTERVPSGRPGAALELGRVHSRSVFRAVPVADRQLVHHGRVQNARMVQNGAVIDEGVVLFEETPIRGADPDAVATTVRKPARIASVQRIFRRGAVIRANQVLALRNLDALLELIIVVAARDAAIELVRKRKHPQQRLPVRVDAGRRDLIARERLTGDWVPNDDQIAVQIATLREIPRAFQCGRRCHLPHRVRRQRVPVLERVKKEELVTERLLRQQNRARPMWHPRSSTGTAAWEFR